jgi:serine/threonine-protein kinase
MGRSSPGLLDLQDDDRQTLIISPRRPTGGLWPPPEAGPPGMEVMRGLEVSAVIDGKYRVVRELGRGGMGIVYLAEDIALQRSVAVKVLHPRHAKHSGHAERFRREARMLAAIEDEHVVHIHALGEHEGLPYLVMDYIMGDTLSVFLAGLQGTYEVIPLDLSYTIARQLCHALSAVHAAGIIHRDVKPGNVMIAAGPRAILMDFSLARDTYSAYSGNHMVGTPDYVAPEQIRGRVLSGKDGQRSDIYSLGVTLFEALTGQLPFQGMDSVSVLHCHLNLPSPRPSEVRPDLPPSFDPVLLRALAKDPAERWASCDELGEALSVAYRAARGVRRRRVLVAAESGSHSQALARMVGAWVPGTDVVTLRGREVVAEVARETPALVVMDLPMGHPLGSVGGDEGPLEICAALRGDPATARVPVVVLAGGDAPAADRRFLRMLGVRAVVNKPVDPVRLAALVRVVVTGDAASALT